MNENSDDYFTSGELSTLYNIPKQTLLYYDKIGFLKPEFIGDNGYQHYNIIQYLTLEIILSLRKLDIPIAQIKRNTFIINQLKLFCRLLKIEIMNVLNILPSSRKCSRVYL